MTDTTDRGQSRGGAMHTRRLMSLAAIAVLAFSACTPAPSAAPTGARGHNATGRDVRSRRRRPARTPSSPPRSPGDYDGATIDIFAQWIEAEGAAFDESLAGVPRRDRHQRRVLGHHQLRDRPRRPRRRRPGPGHRAARAVRARCASFAADGKLVDLGTVLDDDDVKSELQRRASSPPAPPTASSTACTTRRISSPSSGTRSRLSRLPATRRRRRGRSCRR